MERDHLHNRVVCPMQEVDFTNGFFPTPPALYLRLLALGLQLVTSYNNSQRNGKKATKGIDKLRFAFLGRDWSLGKYMNIMNNYMYIYIFICINHWKIPALMAIHNITLAFEMHHSGACLRRQRWHFCHSQPPLCPVMAWWRDQRKIKCGNSDGNQLLHIGPPVKLFKITTRSLKWTLHLLVNHVNPFFTPHFGSAKLDLDTHFPVSLPMQFGYHTSS